MTKPIKKRPKGAMAQAAAKYYFYKHEVPQVFIEEIGDELVKWAQENPEAFSFKQFAREINISSCMIYIWRDKNEKFRDCYQRAADAISARREVGLIKGEYSSHAATMMPHYDKEWRDTLEDRARMKDSGQSNLGIRVVEIPAVVSSDMVSYKKTKE